MFLTFVMPVPEAPAERIRLQPPPLPGEHAPSPATVCHPRNGCSAADRHNGACFQLYVLFRADRQSLKELA